MILRLVLPGLLSPGHQEDPFSRSEGAKVCMVWVKDCLKQRNRVVISISAKSRWPGSTVIKLEQASILMERAISPLPLKT
jgi:hypothetical protein